MAEATLPTIPAAPAGLHGSQGVWLLAWRNLWRNRRRTWLTCGGIGFAVWLLVFALSMQNGTFEIMVDNGARLALGHIQVQHPDYQDDPRLDYTIGGSDVLASEISAMSGVQLAVPRVQGFALMSFGDRSFGAQLMGVDASLAPTWSSLPEMISMGRYIQGPGEAVLGSVLARNLGVEPGDEMVMLGTAKEGGVAAVVAEVVGLFTTGQVELDRGLAQIPIDDFRSGWSLGADEAHAVIVLADTVAGSERIAARLSDATDAQRVQVLSWRDLMPEAEQMIEIKLIGAQLFFALIAIIVSFSIVNTFMMTVFERTPEFGMLMAIGMRPGKIMAQLSVEALYLAVVGVALGVAVTLAILVPLAIYGMPLPADATEILNQYNLPDRMYPAFSVGAAITSSLIMLAGTQIAAFIPALRIRRMRPVDALRAKE